MGLLKSTKSAQGAGNSSYLAGQVAESEAALGELDPNAPSLQAPDSHPTLLQKAIDIMERGHYTVAGAVDEAVNQRGSLLDIGIRAGREFFSGLPGIKGDKETFTDVARQAGLPEGGSPSDVIPGLYNADGEGWRLAKDGLLDPSVLEAGGLGASMVLDPGTYLGFGFKGATKLLTNPAIRKEMVKLVGKKATKQMLAEGKVVLNKKGLQVFEKAYAEVLPKETRTALRLAVKQLGGSKKEAKKIAKEGVDAFREFIPDRLKNYGPEEVIRRVTAVQQHAETLASNRVIRDLGAELDELVDAGGIKLGGHTILSHEIMAPILAPIKASLAKARNSIELTDIVDRVFNASQRGARLVPGYQVAHASLRAHIRQLEEVMDKAVTELIPSKMDSEALGKALYGVGEVPPTQSPALDAVRRQLQHWSGEVGALPIYLKGSSRELQHLAEAVGGTLQADGQLITHLPLSEVLSFAKQARLKSVSAITDARLVLQKAGRHGARQEAFDFFQQELINNSGLAPEIVDKLTAQQLKKHFAALQKDTAKALAKTQKKLNAKSIAPDDPLFGQVASAIRKGATTDLNVQGKELYYLYKIQNTKTTKALAKLIREYQDDATSVLPHFRKAVGLDRAKAVNQWGETFKTLKSGPLKGAALPAAIVDDLAEFGTQVYKDPTTNALLKAYDLFTNVIKSTQTSINPAFNTRNSYSNIAASFVELGLSAFHPGTRKAIVNLMRGKDFTFYTRGKHRYTSAELKALINQYDIVPPGGNMMDLVELGPASNKIVKGAHKFMAPSHFITNKITGPLIENFDRQVIFLTHLRRGLDPREAALRTHKVLFDYGDLSRIEQSWFKRIFPYYTWMRKNLQLQAENIVSEPGRVLRTLKPFTEQNRSGPENDMLPAYLTGDLKIKARKQGKDIFLTGIDLPFVSALEALGGNVSDKNLLAAFAQSAVSQTNPLIQLFPTLATNVQAFAQRDITKPSRLTPAQNAVVKRLPKKTRQWLEYFPDRSGNHTVNGTKAWLFLRALGTNRLLDSGETFVKTRQDSDTSTALLKFFTGVQVREYDLTEAEHGRLRNRLETLHRDLEKRNALRVTKKPNIRNIPKD